MSNLKSEHQAEIDRIHDAQLAAKDAEIERLKEALHEASARNGMLLCQLREKDADERQRQPD